MWSGPHDMEPLESSSGRSNEALRWMAPPKGGNVEPVWAVSLVRLSEPFLGPIWSARASPVVGSTANSDHRAGLGATPDP
jgi:hypothetical protein